MFSKKSRHINLDKIVTTDARGRTESSVLIRLRPDVSGDFLHTLEQGERLDHLAFKYYEDSQKWWHICDADTGFKSPLALVGREPIVTTQLTVIYGAGSETGAPPWYKLIDALTRQTGVRSAVLEQETLLEKKKVDYYDPDRGQDVQVEVNIETLKDTVVVTYNKLNLSRDDIEEVVRGEGFVPVETADTGRIGKQIVIPPLSLEYHGN